jgi:hypothetical protein
MLSDRPDRWFRWKLPTAQRADHLRRHLGHASTETTQVYTLLADKIADTEIRAASYLRSAHDSYGALGDRTITTRRRSAHLVLSNLQAFKD